MTADSQPARARLVVYTVLIGAKEVLGNPLELLPADARSDLDLVFVCLTDDMSLKSPAWTIRPIGMRHLPPEKLSRRPKAMPHEYFLDDEFSLYIDNTVKFKRLPQSNDLPLPPGPPIRGFKHATRSNPRDEAMAVAMLGYDDTATLVRQMDFYKSQGPLEELTPLTTGTVLMRRHHSPSVRRFGVIWWENILAFSKRDQLSIAYALQSAGLDVGYYPGITRDNEFVHWAGSMSPDRVKANFDDKRYAWVHRKDPEAQRNPRGHFLSQGTPLNSHFCKSGALLEYICHDQGSSLGRHVSPRRAIADFLEERLQSFKSIELNYLLVRCQSESGSGAFEDWEFDTATKSLSAFLSPSNGTLHDLTREDIENERVAYKSIETPFDLLILMGARSARLPALTDKFKRILNPYKGMVVFISIDEITDFARVACRSALSNELGRLITTDSTTAWHDDPDNRSRGGAFTLSWTEETVALGPSHQTVAEDRQESSECVSTS